MTPILPGEQAATFVEQGHFDADQITERQAALEARFESLLGPMAHRREKLSDALLLQQFFRDIEDEVSVE